MCKFNFLPFRLYVLVNWFNELIIFGVQIFSANPNANEIGLSIQQNSLSIIEGQHSTLKGLSIIECLVLDILELIINDGNVQLILVECDLIVLIAIDWASQLTMLQFPLYFLGVIFIKYGSAISLKYFVFP